MNTTPAPARVRPRIFYGWYIVGASILMNAYLSFAFFQGFTVLFLPILKEFGWSRTMLSGAFSMRQFESGIEAPLLGFLVDRWGARRVILASVVLAGTGIVLISYATTFWTFYLAFFLASAGVGGASHAVSWAVLVARWFRRRRGLATSIAMMGGAVGGPAVVLVSILEGLVGWRIAVRGLGLGLLAIGIPLALVVRSSPQEHGLQPDGDLSGDNGAPGHPQHAHRPEAGPQQQGATVKDALRSRAFWFLVVILGVQSMSMSGLQVHQVAFFQDRGFSATRAASTVAIAFTVSALGRLLAGLLMDILDWRRVLAGILIGQVLAFLLLVNVSAYWQALVFSVLLGLVQGAGVPARPILVGTVFGTRHLGTIWGLLTGGTVLFGVIGPVLLGWTFDNFRSYVPAFLALNATTALVTPLVFLAPRSLARSPQRA